MFTVVPTSLISQFCSFLKNNFEIFIHVFMFINNFLEVSHLVKNRATLKEFSTKKKTFSKMTAGVKLKCSWIHYGRCLRCSLRQFDRVSLVVRPSLVFVCIPLLRRSVCSAVKFRAWKIAVARTICSICASRFIVDFDPCLLPT